MRALPYIASLVAALCLAACAASGSRPGGDVGASSLPETRVLVMLRTAPPHFRPESGYGGGYAASRYGRESRRRIAESLAGEHGLVVVDSWPMPALGVDCFVMAVATGGASPEIVSDVAADPRVESAQAMNTFHLLGYNDPLYALQPSARLWHLDEIHRITTGRNVRVAEIDSAVETEHPDLRGQVRLSRNFVDAAPDAAEAHGTAVAGIIAARPDNGIGVAGVAPGVELFALRACWQPAAASDARPGAGSGAAICNTFTLAKALQFAIDERAKLINMSLGGPRDRLLERLVDASLQRGIAIVAAVDPAVEDGGFPASHPGVLAVASDDARSAPRAALRAPGRDIPTTIPGHAWGLVSGPSFAAAHVTAVAALLYQLAPALALRELREALAPSRANGDVLEPTFMVDACAAVARTQERCACNCALAQDARPLSAH